MKLERRGEALLPRKKFVQRQAKYVGAAGLMIVASLLIGVLGYHVFGRLGWVDSLLNASFILTGMGPVDPLRTTASKLFASAYAVFSGIVFLSTIGVILTPMVHRLLHRFHLEEEA